MQVLTRQIFLVLISSTEASGQFVPSDSLCMLTGSGKIILHVNLRTKLKEHSPSPWGVISIQ